MRNKSLIIVFLAIHVFIIFHHLTVHGQTTYEMNTSFYEWLDPPDNSCLLAIDRDDDYQRVEIGFPYLFFGNAIQTVKVSSNGFLTYGTNSAFFYSNNNLAFLNYPLDIIAPYWDDLTPAPNGKIYAWVDEEGDSKRFIVQWNSMEHALSSVEGNISFEVILYEGSNEIVFHYKDVIFNSNDDFSFGQSATIGIRSVQEGVLTSSQFCYKQNCLENFTSISFLPSSGNGGDERPEITQYQPDTPDPNTPAVPLESSVIVEFSKPMDTSITGNAFTIEPFIEGQIDWPTNQKLLFTPNELLMEGEKYTVTISCEQTEDLSGNKMEENFKFSFTTLVYYPQITDYTPFTEDPNSLEISLNQSISIEFSEPMNMASTQNAFRISPSMEGAFSWTSEQKLLFQPSSSFEEARKYTVWLIENEVIDKSGLSLQSPFEFSFTTKDQSPPPYPVTLPFVSYNYPLADAENISTTPQIEVHIEKGFPGLDINSLDLKINGIGVTAFAIDDQLDYYLIIYQPIDPFGYSEEITVQVEGKDLSAPPQDMVPYSFSFTTKANPTPIGEVQVYNFAYPVKAMVYGLQDNLWIGTEGGGLFEFDLQSEAIINHYTVTDGLCGNTITSMALDSNKFLWIGTLANNEDPGGIAKFNTYTRGLDTTIPIYNTYQGNSPDNYINDLEVDGDDTLWVATQNSGVIRIVDGNWEVFADSSDLLSENWVEALTFDGSEIWWIGGGWEIYKTQTEGGVSLFDTFNFPITVSSLYCDADNIIWVTTKEGGVYRYAQDGSRPDPNHITTANYQQLLSDDVYDVVDAGLCNEYRYWFATEEGISAASANWNEWISFTMENSELTDNQIYCLWMDGQGTLWFGSETGLNKIDLARPYIDAFGPTGLGIDTTTPIEIWFTEPMDKDSVLNDLSISPSIPSYTYSWDTNDKHLTINPGDPLDSSTTYTVALNGASMDKKANFLCETFSYDFTTIISGDLVPPEILSMTLDGESSNTVPVDTMVYLGFSESMDPNSVKGAVTIYKTGDGTEVPFEIQWESGDTSSCTLILQQLLDYNTGYAVSIEQTAHDLADNLLSSAVSVQFTTMFIDSVPPKILSITLDGDGTSDNAPVDTRQFKNLSSYSI